MSLEHYFSTPGSPRFLKLMADCLTTIGTKPFNLSFLDLIEEIIKADQCMIFSYKDDRPECYLSYRKRSGKIAANLSQNYIRGGFRDDPTLQFLDEVRQSGKSRILYLNDLSAKMSNTYYEEYYASCGITDNVAVIASSEGETLLMNFYRFEENGKFTVSDDDLRIPFWTIISKLALMHYSSPMHTDLKNPLNSLSKREKDVCEAMLEGKTSDAISWQLDISPNTVKTYRQRAYEKLGINSKSALFAICKNPQ